MKNIESFMHDGFYHVFNRTNNRESLFKEEDNFYHFINLYRRYLEPYVHTYAYALLPNHFHFSISVKSQREILETLKKFKVSTYTVAMEKYRFNTNYDKAIHDLISGQFRRFFISYAKSINKHFLRDGSLFQKRFKNPILNTDEKFTWNQYYIHHNARKHGIVDDFRDYPYHSYYELLQNPETFLAKDYVFEWFSSKNHFIQYHSQRLDF